MCPSITLKIFCYSDIKYLFNQSQISCYKLYHPQISIQPHYYNHNILKRYLPRNIFPVIPISDILFQYHPQIYQYHSDNILLQYHSQVSVLQYYHLKYPVVQYHASIPVLYQYHHTEIYCYSTIHKYLAY